MDVPLGADSVDAGVVGLGHPSCSRSGSVLDCAVRLRGMCACVRERVRVCMWVCYCVCLCGVCMCVCVTVWCVHVCDCVVFVWCVYVCLFV